MKLDYTIIISICDILGVKYDVDYLNSLENECSKADYLFRCIYKFLGGK